MKYTERHCFFAAFSCKFSIFMKASFNPGKWVITELNIGRDFSREAWEAYYNLRMYVINWEVFTYIHVFNEDFLMLFLL